ncbi:tRNA lysidine(34) synthetase TilS [Ornithinibacillus halotolerans]|uniref:tRNA(Ile)-lysidine synthase n=1 Tax=Ornithinibacillus halotolerans TaxID=1274357 RepID=A0A916RXG2_9BACI|nr:tRNA lysidine(34) synthetase TilS [Ornithinibacillus halotolerans]GGA71015.1 tRNA(Ile)-lysidine synthase [Ornithinibacillus halotolerans]
MDDVVTSFIQKHQLIKPNSTVLVAVSGGPDSMALLYYFKTIREKWQLNLIALSVDHKLRGEESKQDLEFVRDICHRWNVAFVGTAVDVKKHKEKHQVGTQVAARTLRYQFFEEQMEKFQADYLAIAHHGDDQLETLVMRLVRSANSSSLTGISAKRPFASGAIIRPLLCVTKQEIESYCKKNDIQFRLDPSNESIDYTRNYFRKKIIPHLKSKNENIHKTIQYLSESLAMDEEFLKQEAIKLFNEVVQVQDNPRKVMFDIDVFQSRASALQRRAYHLILNYLYEDDLPKDLSYVHEEQIQSLLNKENGTIQIDFPRHLRVEKAYNKLIFYFHHHNKIPSPFHEFLPIPGEVVLPNGGKIYATYIDEIPCHDKYTYICTSEITLPLQVRTRQPGDRMTWKGLNGSKKIKDIFIDEKIPLHERNSWPIVTDNKGDIIWLVGLRKQEIMPNKGKSIYIKLNYEQGT